MDLAIGQGMLSKKPWHARRLNAMNSIIKECPITLKDVQGSQPFSASYRVSLATSATIILLGVSGVGTCKSPIGIAIAMGVVLPLHHCPWHYGQHHSCLTAVYVSNPSVISRFSLTCPLTPMSKHAGGLQISARLKGPHGCLEHTRPGCQGGIGVLLAALNGPPPVRKQAHPFGMTSTLSTFLVMLVPQTSQLVLPLLSSVSRLPPVSNHPRTLSRCSQNIIDFDEIADDPYGEEG
eukprot:3444548-Amphidinium_carterae.2